MYCPLKLVVLTDAMPGVGIGECLPERQAQRHGYCPRRRPELSPGSPERCKPKAQIAVMLRRPTNRDAYHVPRYLLADSLKLAKNTQLWPPMMPKVSG